MIISPSKASCGILASDEIGKSTGRSKKDNNACICVCKTCVGRGSRGAATRSNGISLSERET